MAGYASQITQLRALAIERYVPGFELYYKNGAQHIENMLANEKKESKTYVIERMLWEIFFGDLGPFCGVAPNEGDWSAVTQQAILSLADAALKASKVPHDSGNPLFHIAPMNRDQTITLLERSFETSKQIMEKGNRAEVQLEHKITTAREAEDALRVEIGVLMEKKATGDKVEGFLHKQITELMRQREQKNFQIQDLIKELNRVKHDQEKLLKSKEGLAAEVKKWKGEVKDARKKQGQAERKLKKKTDLAKLNKAISTQPRYSDDWGTS